MVAAKWLARLSIAATISRPAAYGSPGVRLRKPITRTPNRQHHKKTVASLDIRRCEIIFSIEGLT
jgi:hypothetical protein